VWEKENAEVKAREDNMKVEWRIYFGASELESIKSLSEQTGMSKNEVVNKLLTFGRPSLENSYRTRVEKTNDMSLFGPPDPAIHTAFEDREVVERANAILQKRKAERQDPERQKVIDDYVKRLSDWIQRKRAFGGDDSGAESTVKYEGEES
jgi:hypothetical protein